MSDLTPSAYVVVGIAHCFYKEAGEVRALQLLEPIPSATLETLVQQVPTSYAEVRSLTLGEVLKDDGTLRRPTFMEQGVEFAADFAERAIAAARTYQAHPGIQNHLPIGSSLSPLNFSTEKKRLLKGDRIVRDEDNIKQHSHTHRVL
ncbi:MAG: hypothetical protein HC919_02505 [Oscillatoriales cyanobacterium SM2_2_1]|nr:hypothetical protein [Oscillatoriales cyanobacterium SM2_2_1]